MRSIVAALPFLALACDRQSPPKEPPLPPKPAQPAIEARLQDDLRKLSLEAGIEPPSPPPPSGSLLDEIEAFDSLDACTERLASVDPLLGDALDALGYESLVRDACRLLEALATRDPKRCAPILAGPLRARCEADVATLVGNPEICPQSSAGRDPLCLARAHRDARYCSALSHAEKTSCEAIVSGNPSLCNEDAHCRRQIARWAPFFESPVESTPFAAELFVEVENADGSVVDFDLGDLSAKGAVVRKTKGRYEISLGTKPVGAVVKAAEPSMPIGFFLFKLPLHSKDVGSLPLDPLEARFELLVPGFGLLTSAGGQAKGAFHLTRFSPEPGGEIAFELEAKVADAGRVLPLRAKVRTFVRDLVDEGQARRPPM